MSELPESRVKSASLDPNKKKWKLHYWLHCSFQDLHVWIEACVLGPMITLPQEKHLFLYFYLKEKLALKKRQPLREKVQPVDLGVSKVLI